MCLSFHFFNNRPNLLVPGNIAAKLYYAASCIVKYLVTSAKTVQFYPKQNKSGNILFHLLLYVLHQFGNEMSSEWSSKICITFENNIPPRGGRYDQNLISRYD